MIDFIGWRGRIRTIGLLVVSSKDGAILYRNPRIDGTTGLEYPAIVADLEGNHPLAPIQLFFTAATPLPAVLPHDGATTTLMLQVPAYAPAEEHVFTVVLSSSAGIADSVEGRLVVSSDAPPGVGDSRDVFVALVPDEATTGRGMPAVFRVAVTNLGSVSAGYRLSAGFPAGATGLFNDEEIDVLPGASNVREVELVAMPAAGAAGDAPFTVMAQAIADPLAAATATGLLHVLPFGVHVTLAPHQAAENSLLVLTVENTGTVADDFSLGLAGPAVVAATLGTASVHLSAGASQPVTIQLGQIPMAAADSVLLIAEATSESAPSLSDSDSADIAIAERRILAATLAPDLVVLDQPEGAEYVIEVRNLGNTSDSVHAEILPTDAEVVAGLVGPDGRARSALESLLLPAFSGVSLQLVAQKAHVGEASVTVRLSSTVDPLVSTRVTARLVRIKDCFPVFDLNGDQAVDVADLLLLMEDKEAGNLRSDFNCDGAVDHEDLYLFAEHWQSP